MIALRPTGRRCLTTTAALYLAIGAIGCASVGTGFSRRKPQGAEETYRTALKDMEDGLFPEALKGFSGLKTKYPYTRYAALADLRTADTHFKRGQFTEAVDAYRNFLKYHPNHAQAAYAMMRVGDAFFKQIPTDWVFLPPAAEKDQANTRLAITAYRDMIGRFPDHVVADQARKRLNDARAKLAEHELYVADFYYKQQQYRAALGRAEGLLASYGGLGYDITALWIAARSYLELGDTAKARSALTKLNKDYPDSPEAGNAASLLRTLGTTAPSEGD